MLITSDAILFDGTQVDSVAKLERLTRLDGLFARIKTGPGDQLQRHDVSVEIAADATMIGAASAIETAAFAGLRRARIRSGDLSASATYSVPGGNDRAPWRFTRLNLVGHGDKRRAVWQSNVACAEIPSDEDVSLGALRSYLDRACATSPGCVRQVRIDVDSSTHIRDFLSAISAADSHSADGRLDLSFTRGSTPIARRCGDPTVGARLLPDDIHHVLRSVGRALRACYDKVQPNPKVERTVTMKFTVEPDGSVSEAADAGNALQDKDVVACLVALIRVLRFPPSDQGKTTAVYPFHFAP
jgi:hypothetical protein